MPTEFKLPELGENITAGDVLRVMVSAGDTIAKDQPVVELETDKATIEVPSSVAGVITDIRVKAGDKVKVGQSILVVDEASAGGQAAPPESERREPAKAAPREESKREETPAKSSRPQAADSRPSREPAEEPRGAESLEEAGKNIRKAEGAEGPEGEGQPEPPAQPDAAEETKAPRGRRGEVVDIRGSRAPAEPTPPAPAEAGPLAPAAPSVRRIARELGVDINEVSGSGPAERISADDVKAHAKKLIAGSGSGPRGVAAAPLPDFSRWGEIERKPMRAVRRKTAEHLTRAWTTVPHVTQNDRADITELEAARQKYAKRAEQAGGQLTVTAILVKVLASAVKVFPQFNVSIDVEAEELIYKKYVHIGVAVDTDRGLLVPVIRDADKKNIVQLAAELSQAAEKARTNKLTLPEMEGGSITITNLGGIGGTSFSPIVNAPEVAILGVSRASMQPLWSTADNQFAPRLVLPLSLSYDHRVIDGADAARFLRWVVEALEQPILLALQG
jgi:pyruvate dehydrogenase E2 component (dihydrolipoamide acetyltransferase)